ncbi:methylamine utilization protein [Aliidiomarina sp. Khilg15.8]
MKFRMLLVSGALCGAAVVANATEITITVNDEQGEPLANAVVTYASDTQENSSVTKHEVVQRGRKFVPNTTLIQRGDTVTFPNQDSLRHHVYSFSAARTFEFELYGGDVSPSMDFPDTGLVVLGCNIHDDMIGYIVIDEQANGGVTDTDGRITLNPTQATEFRIWHGAMLEPGLDPVVIAYDDLSAQQYEVTMPFSVEPDDAEESELERRFKGFGK